MRLRKHRREHALTFRMTPMIDIVFLLLIFFMTVSQISHVNSQFLQLPAVGPVTDSASKTTVTINITQSGSYLMAGEPVNLEQIASRVGVILGEMGNDPSRLSILVRCDRRTPSLPVNQLLSRLRDLGIGQVRTGVIE